ncbi:Mediator of DNA damage checkpoint protein 1 [Homalodisca vitripennis]|nr:Mediator of DNA damage checkpoint protein 1 [Homalodisca vitripennis]
MLLIQEVSHDIFRGVNVIGRDEVCDIVIRSGAISSKHAVIEVEDWDTHLVYDCGSTNNTRLGKTILKPNVRYNLQGDDHLTFADLKAVYTKIFHELSVKNIPINEYIHKPILLKTNMDIHIHLIKSWDEILDPIIKELCLLIVKPVS